MREHVAPLGEVLAHGCSSCMAAAIQDQSEAHNAVYMTPRLGQRRKKAMRHRDVHRITPRAGERPGDGSHRRRDGRITPRAGARQQHTRHIGGLYRITPAHGGETRTICPNMVRSSDHPRVREKDGLPEGHIVLDFGSPPRAGKRRRNFLTGVVDRRITPAHGGRQDELPKSL